MKILIRDKNSKKWKFADSVSVKAEAELQKLLVESPSLITLDDIREGVSHPVFAVREFSLPGSGATDVLAFTANGDIIIMECKLATNTEIKRKVIGQILEYAAHLWQMEYEEIDSRIKKLKNKNLAELIEESVTEEWDEESFRNGIIHSLESGSFILIIVVDEINEELRRIIRYINECSESAFSLHALEMQRFQSETIDVIVPHIYGVSPKPPPSGPRKQWTEDDFFRTLNNEAPNMVNTVRELYDWSTINADRIWFGAGKETGSFTFHYLKEGKTVSVFSIYTNGRITLNYGWLSKQVKQEVIEEFHSKIREIPTFRHISNDFSKWPSLPVLNAFKEKEHLEYFKQTVITLGSHIK